MTGVDHTLVEDNLIERIGGRVSEMLLECAGLKFHFPGGVLIRRNVFRHISHASGLWLDVPNRNCRVTGNVFADIESRSAALQIECNRHLNVVDNNLIWDVRGTSRKMGRTRKGQTRRGRTRGGLSGGVAILGDSGDHLVVAHNFIGKVPDSYAIDYSLRQRDRVIGGRVGGGSGHRALNNVFFQCPKRITFTHADEIASDGNLFDAVAAPASLSIQSRQLDLEAWQERYGLDKHSTEARIEADFDVESLELTWKVDGERPTCQAVDGLHEASPRLAPGPLDPEQWERSLSGQQGRQAFCTWRKTE